MSFISFAQNYEDVILFRALKNVERGFYIDVGANDPVVDSVTKAFYNAGWNGINIDPVAQWHSALVKDRPRDINLKLAAGESEGSLKFYEVIGTGLSTSDEVLAKGHAKKSGFDLSAYDVLVRSLTSICNEYVNSEVHFLKIDVEGAELSVLKGLDLKNIRPWIIVVESTLPTTVIESYDEWEAMIVSADYSFVYFDGLNRFYVAKEHHSLKNSLQLPPNIFDNFVLSGMGNASGHKQVAEVENALMRSQGDSLKLEKMVADRNERNGELELMLQQGHEYSEGLEVIIREKEERNYELERWLQMKSNEIERIEGLLQELFSSSSWRITKPLRGVKPILMLTLNFTKRLIRRALISIMYIVIGQPRIKSVFQGLLRKFPVIRGRLKRIFEGPEQSHNKVSSFVCSAEKSCENQFAGVEMLGLSSSGLRIYNALKNAVIEENKS